jgi:hypothetical protein
MRVNRVKYKKKNSYIQDARMIINVKVDYLHENDKEEAQIHRQVKQVPNKFQIKGVNRLFFPLSFHKHVAHIENIFYKC